MAKPIFLMVGAFLFSAGASYVYIHTRPAPVAPVSPVAPVAPAEPPTRASEQIPPTQPTDSAVLQSVANYKAPEGRSPEMQVFDKAVLYLSAAQESDGHWSAANSGAAPEFTNTNGDIIITAQLTSTLLDACSFKQSNPDALAHAKKALDWLNARVRADGGIADDSGPGEPVTAQLYAALAFLQAVDLSSRATVRENAAKLCRYTAKAMQAQPGGFGATPKAKAARADLTALATIMFNQARAAELPLHEASGKAEKLEANLESEAGRAVERSIRAGLNALRCEPKTDGRFALASDKLEANWGATVDALLVSVAFVIQGPEVESGFEYVLGTHYDIAEPTRTKSFPAFERQVKWGDKGEGFAAASALNMSWLLFYSYGPNQPVWDEWTKYVTKLLVSHASPDGTFAVAGPDSKLGRYARTSNCARILALLAPPIPTNPQQSNPPQSPQPPPQTSAPGK